MRGKRTVSWKAPGVDYEDLQEHDAVTKWRKEDCLSGEQDISEEESAWDCGPQFPTIV